MSRALSALRGIIDYDVIRLDKESLGLSGLSSREMMDSVNNILLARGLKSYIDQLPNGMLVFEENSNDIVSDFVLADVIDYLASLNLYNTEETLGYLNQNLRDNRVNIRLVVYAWPEALGDTLDSVQGVTGEPANAEAPVRYEYEIVSSAPL